MYNSVDDRGIEPSLQPPVANIVPFCKSVVVNHSRGVLILPVLYHVSVERSYRSADANTPLVPSPPATNISPLGNSVAA